LKRKWRKKEAVPQNDHHQWRRCGQKPVTRKTALEACILSDQKTRQDKQQSCSILASGKFEGGKKRIQYGPNRNVGGKEVEAPKRGDLINDCAVTKVD